MSFLEKVLVWQMIFNLIGKIISIPFVIVGWLIRTVMGHQKEKSQLREISLQEIDKSRKIIENFLENRGNILVQAKDHMVQAESAFAENIAPIFWARIKSVIELLDLYDAKWVFSQRIISWLKSEEVTKGAAKEGWTRELQTLREELKLPDENLVLTEANAVRENMQHATREALKIDNHASIYQSIVNTEEQTNKLQTQEQKDQERTAKVEQLI